ncbi:MAG: cytochrome c-type biogenesis protein CcmH [Gaiellaceae bacterium]
MRHVALAVLAAAVLVPVASASESRPTQNELEGEIMCPVCGTTLDQSDAAIARQMKMFIASRINASDSKSEIEDALVARFGEEVLAAPPKEGFNLLAWVLPLAGLGVAIPLLAWGAWRWSRGREPDAEPASLEPELEHRLDRELARFDA